jgi:hypothetical protein
MLDMAHLLSVIERASPLIRADAHRRPVEDPAHLGGNLPADTRDEGQLLRRGRHDGPDGAESLQQSSRALRPDTGEALQEEDLPCLSAFWAIPRSPKSAMNKLLRLPAEVHQQPRALLGIG